MFMSLTAEAQKITFTSPGIEVGVRMHLGLDESSDIMQSRTDTITAINLSGLGINSLSDIVYLPNVEVLDLSDNDITDVGPLNALSSLRDLNLKGNELESINLLAFSSSAKMMVDVTSNYISDFSFLFDCFHCQLTLVGMGMQKVKDAPYFDVYQLYADVGEDGAAKVCYRGYTNLEGSVIEYGGAQTAATLDGNTYEAAVPGNPQKAVKVSLINGEYADSTWAMPTMTYSVDDGSQITIETGLPANYRIGNLYALHGTVSSSENVMASGWDIVYDAPAEAVNDVVNLSYYEGSRLRGFAKVNIVRNGILPGDANCNGAVTIADVIAIINRINNVNTDGTFIEQAADVNGDGFITIADVTKVIEIILGKQKKQE